MFLTNKDEMFLTKEELIGLTGRHRKDGQKLVLRYIGIEHKVRPDGSLAVLKEHVTQQFGASVPKNSLMPRIEPNWAAI